MEGIGSEHQFLKRSEKVSYVEDSAISKPKILSKKNEPSEKLSANHLTPDAAASKRFSKSSSNVVAKRSPNTCGAKHDVMQQRWNRQNLGQAKVSRATTPAMHTLQADYHSARQ
jgi:hypothetical protein